MFSSFFSSFHHIGGDYPLFCHFARVVEIFIIILQHVVAWW